MPCHYRRHLRGSALSVYEFALGLAGGLGGEFFASNATTISGTSYSRDSVIRAKKSLVRLGWFVPIGGNRDAARHGGQFQPDRFRVVGHDEWVQHHPGECSRVGKTPRRHLSDTEKCDFPASAKCDSAASAKPVRNIRNNSGKGKGMEGNDQLIQSLPVDCWFFMDGPTGDAGFDEFWERIYAEARGTCLFSAIAATAACAGDLPDAFAVAAQRYIDEHPVLLYPPAPDIMPHARARSHVLRGT